VEAGVLLRPSVRLNPQRLDATEGVGNELRLGAALVTTGRRLRWEFNVRGMLSLEGQPGTAELLPGARYLVNPSLELFALAGVGIGAAPGTPAFRLLVGGSFGDVTPPRGPGESSVNCEPNLPHTVDDCPDMDEDQDGTPNAVDRCPLETGTPERSGCPRQDTDGDGVEDMLDGCPQQPGLASLRGCPVQDADGDELPDEQDSCPAEPGPPENRGCPVKDSDGDGIENDQDSCPAEPGPPERQGCPEEDTDKDGVPNRADSCVSAPGPEQNAGCPQHEVPSVLLTPRQLELKGKVYFEAAQARVQQRSYLLLNWVARVLNEHPEIPLVVVGAHTDDRGFADANRRLSQQRAEAVRDYLIEKGVSPGRLQAKGYGPDRPIDSNATSIGRENNRRVEFLIIRHQDESTQVP
jgi:outer membrane protein OmpA-like peptidoglycan-associated protein